MFSEKIGEIETNGKSIHAYHEVVSVLRRAAAGAPEDAAGHLLLAWGTNLAMFPIMGQPMSFLSAGGSHLLFFICPLLAFGAASAQSLEET